jgi:hypothetical protein
MKYDVKSMDESSSSVGNAKEIKLKSTTAAEKSKVRMTLTLTQQWKSFTTFLSIARCRLQKMSAAQLEMNV